MKSACAICLDDHHHTACLYYPYYYGGGGGHSRHSIIMPSPLFSTSFVRAQTNPGGDFFEDGIPVSPLALPRHDGGTATFAGLLPPSAPAVGRIIDFLETAPPMPPQQPPYCAVRSRLAQANGTCCSRCSTLMRTTTATAAAAEIRAAEIGKYVVWHDGSVGRSIYTPPHTVRTVCSMCSVRYVVITHATPSDFDD